MIHLSTEKFQQSSNKGSMIASTAPHSKSGKQNENMRYESHNKFFLILDGEEEEGVQGNEVVFKGIGEDVSIMQESSEVDEDHINMDGSRVTKQNNFIEILNILEI